MTLFCPCITFGRIAEILDRGSASCGLSGALYALLQYLTWFHWVYSCTYRTKMRAQYSLVDAPCTDCLVHCCCEQCALCQEYRELKNRDFDMFIGINCIINYSAMYSSFFPLFSLSLFFVFSRVLTRFVLPIKLELAVAPHKTRNIVFIYHRTLKVAGGTNSRHN